MKKFIMVQLLIVALSSMVGFSSWAQEEIESDEETTTLQTMEGESLDLSSESAWPESDEESAEGTDDFVEDDPEIGY